MKQIKKLFLEGESPVLNINSLRNKYESLKSVVSPIFNVLQFHKQASKTSKHIRNVKVTLKITNS